MQRYYDLGVAPDWWKLEPVEDTGFWTAAGDIVRANDPHLQGSSFLARRCRKSIFAGCWPLRAPNRL
ncbi:MAG: hypothetical protein CM15mP115_05090 [Alphaproteobacteria bacterium]|nr:MAG: hypothetical protein CM15mP115_05090 [Alphaproteobacteria bacterium]